MKIFRLSKLMIIMALTAVVISGCSIQTTDNRLPVVKNQQSTTLPAEDPSAGILKVHYIDVGQGDSILVQSDGQNMLIDAGDNDQGQKVVTYLEKVGVKQLDVVVGTHPHADHIGGLDTVIAAFPVKAVYMPRIAHTSKSFGDLLDAIEAKGLKINSARAGVEIPLTGVTAEILAPVKQSYEDLNNYSAVIRVSSGEQTFLFMGDAEKEVEEELLSAEQDLHADVLKVGHHGSNSGTCSAFLAAVKPQYAIIQVGADNKYGHPHREPIDRLTRSHTEIIRTDHSGTVVITISGQKLDIKAEK